MEDHTSKPKNIFEAASQVHKTKVQKQPEESRPAIQEGENVKEMIHKGEKFHKEISSKVDTAFTVHQILPSKYRHYFSQPKNFSEKDWKAIEEQKKKNEELLIALGKRIGKTAQAPKKEEKEAPLEPEKKPIKRGKIITKRNWISM